MEFAKSFNLFGIEGKEIPCITGKGAPTVATKGAVGCLYMDENTGYTYRCTAVANGVHTWRSTDKTFAELAEVFNVDHARLTELIAMDSAGGLHTYEHDATDVEFSIRSNGVFAGIGGRVISKTISPGYASALKISIPDEFRPFEGSVMLYQDNTMRIMLSVTDNDAQEGLLVVVNDTSSALTVTEKYFDGCYALRDVVIDETKDICVGFDGKTYATAGEAVRGQIGTLNSDLADALTYSEETDITHLLNEDGAVKTNGANYETTTYRRSDYIHLKKGYTVIASGVRASNMSVIAVYSGSKVFDAENSILGTGSKQSFTFIMPHDGYVRLCCRLTELNTGSAFTITNIIGKKFSTVDSNVSALHSAAATVNKYTVNAEAITENPNTYILENLNGTLANTGDPVGCSDLRACNPGDKLIYKLSLNTDWVILATYDKDCNLLACVKGAGQSNFAEGEYTFVEGEAYFRIAGVIGYRENYYVEFVPVHNYKIGLEMADVEEAIENALETDTLPDYYIDYMAERIAAINNKDCLIGGHGDSFVFITDTHIERNNMQSPNLIRKVVDNTAVRFVINGGDTLDRNSTRGEALGLLRQWRNLMRGVTEYRIMGNHDLNASGQTVEEAILSFDDWYGTMVKPIEDMVNTNGKYYFCIDNESQKIRYICLSYKVNLAAERNWFKQRLTELEAGWTVLVIPHYLFDSTTDVIHANGQYVIDDINEVYANMNATLIGILAGHTHADYYTTEPTNGYNLIATTCDAFTGTPTKTAGTVTEQAFDVIHIDTTNRKMYATRIGAGEDREWSY